MDTLKEGHQAALARRGSKLEAALCQEATAQALSGPQAAAPLNTGGFMEIQTKHQCPKCGNDLKRIYSKKKSKHYWACMGPEELCDAIYSERNGEPVLLVFGDPDPTCPCPECGAPMRMVKGGQYGDYWSCAAYPKCKGSLDIMPNDELPPLCPEDGDHGPMRIRPGKNGKFLGCRKYPDCIGSLEMDGLPSKRNKGDKGDTP